MRAAQFSQHQADAGRFSLVFIDPLKVILDMEAKADMFGKVHIYTPACRV